MNSGHSCSSKWEHKEFVIWDNTLPKHWVDFYLKQSHINLYFTSIKINQIVSVPHTVFCSSTGLKVLSLHFSFWAPHPLRIHNSVTIWQMVHILQPVCAVDISESYFLRREQDIVHKSTEGDAGLGGLAKLFRGRKTQSTHWKCRLQGNNLKYLCVKLYNIVGFLHVCSANFTTACLYSPFSN